MQLNLILHDICFCYYTYYIACSENNPKKYYNFKGVSISTKEIKILHYYKNINSMFSIIFIPTCFNNFLSCFSNIEVFTNSKV